MYNGERVAVAPVAQPVMPRDVMSDAVAEGMRHVAAQVGQLVRTGAQMEDAKNEFESERALMALQDSTRKQMERRLHLPDGHEEAFFDKAGNIRETQMADMKARVDKALGGIGVNIIDPERRQQMQQKAGLAGARLLDSIGQTWESVQREKMETSWRDALELAEERGQQGEAFSLIERGVQMGIIQRSRGELLKARMENKRLRGLGAAARSGMPQVVTLGGREYSGASAALAMVAGEGEAKGEAKAEVPATAEVPQDGAMVAPQSAVVAPEEVVAPQLVSAWDGVLPEPNSLDAYTMLPESERIALVDDFTFDRKVLTMTDDMGKEHFSCPTTAPETVQRVAAQAELKGELDVDTCRGMVARITMDAAVENPEVSTEQVLKMFDDSGIYGALGAGDAEVGKARTRAIVEEMRQRAQAGTTKVNMATIERMVKAKVNEPTFGAGQEWKSMEALDPMLKKKSDEYPEWEKSSDDVQRKKWFALYDVYKKYRADYNPYAEGEADRDDFNKHAGAFYEWYKENVYKPQKEAAQAAARDYYTAAVVEELTKSVLWSEGKAVYQGYANDVAVASEVLKRTLPNDLGVEALQAREAEAEREDALRTTRFREMAKEDYKKLHGLKQAEAENSAAAKKAREKQEDAERRKAEKEAREAEKRAEQQEARRLFVARSQPRQANWAWDGANAPDGAQPLCTVPVEEYRRLQQELGFDGSQVVYLRVGDTKVLVMGHNDTGKVQLNTPAVLKIQAKPNSKKGEQYRVSGELGYFYQFTNAK